MLLDTSEESIFCEDKEEEVPTATASGREVSASSSEESQATL